MKKWLTEVIKVGNAHVAHLGRTLFDRRTPLKHDGQLSPGFYLVLWPARSPGTEMHRPPRLFGPYPTAHGAEQMRQSARFLGLT